MRRLAVGRDRRRPTPLKPALAEGFDNQSRQEADGRVGALMVEPRSRVESGRFFGHIAFASLTACKPGPGDMNILRRE